MAKVGGVGSVAETWVLCWFECPSQVVEGTKIDGEPGMRKRWRYYGHHPITFASLEPISSGGNEIVGQRARASNSSNFYIPSGVAKSCQSAGTMPTSKCGRQMNSLGIRRCMVYTLAVVLIRPMCIISGCELATRNLKA